MQDRTMIVALIAVVGSFLSYQTVKSWREADEPRVSRSAVEMFNKGSHGTVNEPALASQVTGLPARGPASE